MTLRDALAAALMRSWWPEEPDTPVDRAAELDATNVLSDPAFRAALTEAVAEAEWFIEDDAWCPGPEKHRDRAAAIVARMLRG